MSSNVNNLINNLNNRLLTVLNNIVTTTSLAASYGMGKYLPISYTAPLIFATNTQVLKKKVGGTNYLVFTYTFYFLDGIGDPSSVVGLQAILDDIINNYSDYLDLYSSSFPNPISIITKGAKIEGVEFTYDLDKLNLPVDPCCDIILIEGPAGSSGSSGTGGSGTSGTGSSGSSGLNGSSGSTGAAGTSGSSGSNGTSVEFNYIGLWTPASYVANTVAISTIDNNTYVSTVVTTNVYTDPANDSTEWELLVYSGASGSSGSTGAAGSSGSTGAAGSSGSTGASGSSGSTGASGSSGSSGVNGISAGRNYFFNESQDSDILGYKVLSDIPTFTTQQIVTQSVSAGSTVLMQQFLTPEFGFTTIPAGIQRFFIYWLKNNVNNNFSCYVSLELADLNGIGYGTVIPSGTALIGWINASTPVAAEIDVVFPTTSVLATDRMIVKVYATNFGGGTHPINFYTEDGYYSFVTTSIAAVSGTSGSSGSSGINGADGTSGSSGINGIDGSSGAVGSSGSSGANGSSGSSASVSGATNSIQFNNGGTLGGATNSFIINGNVALSVTPTAASASSSGLVVQALGGTSGIDSRLSSVDLYGRIIQYGTNSANKIISRISPSGNNILIGEGNWNSVVLQSFVGATAPGAVTRAYDATNLAPNFFVTAFKAANNAANGFCGIRIGNTSRAGIQWMSNRSGAFLQVTMTFRAWNTASRLFVGYQSLNSTPSASARIDSYLSMVGLGKDDNNTNLQWMTNTSSGTATTVDTGILPNVNDVYRMSIYIPPTCDVAYFTLEQLTYTTTTIVSSHTATTNLPGLNQQSYFMIHMNNGTGGGTIPSLELILAYEELYMLI
jgi:collagen type VII alpha